MDQGIFRFLLSCFAQFVFILAFQHAGRAEEFKLGWIGPLTGNAAILGVDSAEAVKIAVSRHNRSSAGLSHPVKLFIEDDHYQTAQTVRSYRRLVNQEGVRVLFVLTYGGLFAVNQLAQKDGVLLIDPLDCNEHIAALGENTFCISQLTENLGRRNAELAHKNGHSPAGIIYFASDPFMGVLADATKLRLQELQVEISLEQSYAAGTRDFKTILLQAKSKGIRSLFLYGYDEMGVAMRQARELGINSEFYAVGTVTSPGLLKSAGNTAEGAFVSVWQPPKNGKYQKFLKSFARQTGRKRPNFEVSTVPAYDFTNILIDFWTSTAHLNRFSYDSLRQHLYATRGYPGASGEISMSPDGAVRTLPIGHWRLRNDKLIAE